MLSRRQKGRDRLRALAIVARRKDATGRAAMLELTSLCDAELKRAEATHAAGDEPRALGAVARVHRMFDLAGIPRATRGNGRR